MPGRRRHRGRGVADVDPGDTLPGGDVPPGPLRDPDPGDLGSGDAGDGVDAVQVGVERCRGPCARQRDERLDRSGRVDREVTVQRLRHLPDRRGGGQRPGVRAAPGDAQERRGQGQQPDHDHRGVDGRPAHDAVRQPVPGPAGLVPGRPAHRAADAQRVDPVAEDGEQRGQHGQRGQHVHRDGGHPAVAHRAQEVLGEQHQAGQRDRDRDARDRDGAARGGHRPGDRLLDGRLPVQFLAEPGDHEEPVVDAQAQAQDRGDVHRVDGNRGGHGEQPQHGERAEDGHAADRHRQRGRGQAAEDHQQQDQQDRHREPLGLGDVGGDLGVDRDLHRHGRRRPGRSRRWPPGWQASVRS